MGSDGHQESRRHHGEGRSERKADGLGLALLPGWREGVLLDSDLGDDAGPNTDYNDTDDGLIVTNALGQVLG